jgi:hypothetical protein
MLQPRTLGVATLLGLLASTAMSAAASAGERAYFRGSTGGEYWSEPRVRLGVDVVWGGYGYAPTRPPVVWYPAPRSPVVWYPAYYAPDRDYDSHYNRGHGRGHNKHRRHAHYAHDRDDCAD